VAIGFLCDEMWTVGPQPVLRAARCVYWRAVLMKDDGGRPAIALKER